MDKFIQNMDMRIAILLRRNADYLSVILLKENDNL